MTRMLIKGKAAYQARLVDRLREEVQWLHPVASLFFSPSLTLSMSRCCSLVPEASSEKLCLLQTAISNRLT
jgi:hypothetical protein